MTTIACNTKSIACDLQFSYGGHTKFQGSTKILELKGEVPKKMFNEDKVLIGFSGNANAWGKYVTWFYDNPFENKPPKAKDIEFLMITSSHKIYWGSNMSNWMLLPQKHWAIGSGSHLALTAMDAGQDPKGAIKIASKHDLHTGMGCKVYTI